MGIGTKIARIKHERGSERRQEMVSDGIPEPVRHKQTGKIGNVLSYHEATDMYKVYIESEDMEDYWYTYDTEFTGKQIPRSATTISDCKWDGGGDDWFLITCNSEEARNMAVGKLMSLAPRFTKFSSGEPTTFQIQNKNIGTSKEAGKWFLGMFIEAGITVNTTQENKQYWTTTYYEIDKNVLENRP